MLCRSADTYRQFRAVSRRRPRSFAQTSRLHRGCDAVRAISNNRVQDTGGKRSTRRQANASEIPHQSSTKERLDMSGPAVTIQLSDLAMFKSLGRQVVNVKTFKIWSS